MRDPAKMPTALAHIAASPLAGCLTDLQLDGQTLSGRARLCCPPDFPGFAGHFPDQPVLPAVLQLLAVRLLSESVLAATLTPEGVERLKFKGMVAPDDRLDLRVTLREQAGRCRSEFRLERAGAPIASGTLIFRRRAGEE